MSSTTVNITTGTLVRKRRDGQADSAGLGAQGTGSAGAGSGGSFSQASNYSLTGTWDFTQAPTVGGVVVSLAGHTHDDRYFTEAETTSAISTAIANLVDSSPATLDTLNELATALGDDPNFATTVSTAIGLRAPIANPMFTGTINASDALIIGGGNEIWTQATINATADLYINNRGYAAGYTQFRNIRINNGKGGNIVYFDGVNNRVGILNTSPGYTLDVQGETLIGGSSAGVLYIRNSANNPTVQINSNTSGNSWFANGGGNVGIGTTTPIAKIDIVSGVNAGPATSGTSGSGVALRLSGADSGVLDFGVNSGNYSWIQARDKNYSTNYPLVLQPNGDKVGIGTTAPGQLLTLTKIVSGQNIAKLSFEGQTGAASNSDNGGVEFHNDNYSYYSGVYGWRGGDSTESGLNFKTSNGAAPTTVMTILPSGNVGIGTVNPTKSLVIQKNVANGVGASLFLRNDQYAAGTGAETEIIMGVYTENNLPYRYGKIHTVGNDTSGDVGRMSFGIGTSNVAYSDYLTILAGGNVLIGQTTGSEKLCVTGNQVITSGYLNSEELRGNTPFVLGFYGAGYKMVKSGSDYNLECDNVVIRKGLRAFAFEVDKIDVVGGRLVVSTASGTVYSVSGTTLYFDTSNNTNPIQFKVGDYIASQKWAANPSSNTKDVIASYRGRVTGVVQGSGTLGTGYITTTTISGTAWAGMGLAQMGSDTDSARQNLIYMTASETNNPFIEGHSGVTDGTFSDTTRKFRLGNLTGITDATLSPSGYGLYAQNVFLSGKIVASAGTIGGWVIGSNYFQDAAGTVGMSSAVTGGDDVRFWAGSATISSAPFKVTKSGTLTATLGSIGGFTITANELYAGTGATRVEMQAAGGFWAGDNAFASAPFSVSPAGALTAKGIAELGTAISTYDGVSNIAIKGADIWENSYNGDNSHLYINRLGYNGGSSYYRNLNIYDGKGTALLTVSGNTQSVIVNKDLQIYGTTECVGNLRFNGTGPKKFIVPKMTNSQKLGMTAEDGMIVYITDLGQFHKYAGAWYIV